MNTLSKKRLIWSSAAFFVVICLMAFVPTIINVLNPFSGRLSSTQYVASENGYAFTPPASWLSTKIMNGKTPGIVFSGDHGLSTIRIYTVPVPVGSGPHAASEVTVMLEKQSALLQNYKLVSDAPMKFKDYDSYQYEMTYLQNSKPTRARTMVVTGEHAVYIIVATAPESIWQQFQAPAEKSIATFVLLPKTGVRI